jgi:hypothetical protein
MYLQQTLNYNKQEHKTNIDMILGEAPLARAALAALVQYNKIKPVRRRPRRRRRGGGGGRPPSF